MARQKTTTRCSVALMNTIAGRERLADLLSGNTDLRFLQSLTLEIVHQFF
jgi:hypothetical protein